jgi:CheY-like chemotaxis protein
MHGGTVGAESAGEGTGATFTVRLPLMAVHQVSGSSHGDLQVAGEPQPALTTLGDLGGIHVLAVDDERDALSLLAVVLESAGARVTTVSSASEALAQLAAARPDVIVADIGMPDVDGFQLIKQIRASEDPVVREVPAAALTAYARSEDRTRALRSGFDMHLAKPIDPAELVASVSMLARRARQSS